MLRLLIALTFLGFVAASTHAADDPAMLELAKAKAAHSKELTRLRDKLLADIDAVIKSENDRGAGIDYLLKERKGFVENGVTPILPKLLPASRQYLDGKKVAHTELEQVYTAAISASRRDGNADQVARLQGELKALRGTAQIPQDSKKDPIPSPDSGDVKLSRRKGGEVVEVEIVKGMRMKLCWIPPGTAQLGSTKEEEDYVTKAFYFGKRNEVLDGETEGKRGTYTSKGYWLGKYVVTQAEYEAVAGKNPSKFVPSQEEIRKAGIKDTSRFPVESVSWEEAAAFVKKLNVPKGMTKGQFCLPNEDEWEYACRGGLGNKRAFYFGNVLDGTQANCDGSQPYGTLAKGPYLRRPTEVGSYEQVAPHPWGLCDMHGNVWQWCENVESGKGNVLRGGAFNYAPVGHRSASRFWFVPGNFNDYRGFRLCFRPE
jgi:formylglycine-generating enzyme